MSDLEKNLQLVQQRIAAAAERARRDPREITLVAVSKTQPGEAILATHALGAQHFGENRVEEAREKIPLINAKLQMPNDKITWHLIGHLQSRKVRDAVALFDVVQSVDSLALAQRLSERAGALGKTLAILLEVNVSGEATKSGFALAARAEFFDAARAISVLPNLDAQGLMTLAPMVANPDDARPYFRALRELRDDLRAQVPNRAWQHLSMGMTDDFGSAIAEGATMVRIGRAIFGERK